MRSMVVIGLGALVLASCGQHSAPDGNESVATPKVGGGPFGLDPSAKLADLAINKKASDPGQGFYLLENVPTPSGEFETYAVKAFDGVGLCEIRAISKTGGADSLGGATKGQMDKLAATLEVKYGKPKLTDVCAGDIQCQPQFWSMALMNGERAYAYNWDLPNKGAALIRSISLAALSTNLGEPFYRLDYSLNDKAACEKAEKAAGASNL